MHFYRAARVDGVLALAGKLRRGRFEIEQQTERVRQVDVGEVPEHGSVDMSIETFYNVAMDADYVIYNGSIDGSVKTMSDLLQKDPVMKKLKAVKNDNCWVTGNAMMCSTTGVK